MQLTDSAHVVVGLLLLAAPATVLAKPARINVTALFEDDATNSLSVQQCAWIKANDPGCGWGLNCDLLDWKKAGCKKMKECENDNAQEAKKCCDKRNIVPVNRNHYKIYLSTCAPNYRFEENDLPSPPVSCETKFYCDTSFMDRNLCNMHDWSKRGCAKGADECRGKTGDKLEKCCAKWKRDPEGDLKDLFAERFTAHCELAATN